MVTPCCKRLTTLFLYTVKYARVGEDAAFKTELSKCRLKYFRSGKVDEPLCMHDNKIFYAIEGIGYLSGTDA